MTGSGREACRMSWSGQKTLPDVQEWSGGPPGCLGLVGRPPQMPEVVGRTSGMSEGGREALPNVRKWLGGPLGCPGVVEGPSWMSGSGR